MRVGLQKLQKTKESVKERRMLSALRYGTISEDEEANAASSSASTRANSTADDSSSTRANSPSPERLSDRLKDCRGLASRHPAPQPGHPPGWIAQPPPAPHRDPMDEIRGTPDEPRSCTYTWVQKWKGLKPGEKILLWTKTEQTASAKMMILPMRGLNRMSSRMMATHCSCEINWCRNGLFHIGRVTLGSQWLFAASVAKKHGHQCISTAHTI